MIDRREFLWRVVPAAAGIVVAPAAALELLERKRYWPGFGPGTTTPSAVAELNRLIRDLYVPELTGYMKADAALAKRLGTPPDSRSKHFVFPVEFA